jgi:hypothetical protein
LVVRSFAGQISEGIVFGLNPVCSLGETEPPQDHNPDKAHLKSWLVETLADGKNWREIASDENSERLHGCRFTGTFAAVGGKECDFIRLVNIGRNHFGNDQLGIPGREILGNVVE